MRTTKKFRRFLDQSIGREHGQTAVEYILLIVVLVSIIVPLTNKLREHFLGGSDDGACKQANKSVICFFKRGLSSNYKTYKIP